MGSAVCQSGERAPVVAGLRYGVQNIGGTQWAEIPAAALANVEGLDPGSAISATVDFVAPGPDGQAGIPGQAVQILAIDPVTGQTSGTSFEIPRS